MIDKVIILGLGSMGDRHMTNLRTLRPQARIIGADPMALFELADGDAMYADWRRAIADNPDADAAIIASPTAAHLDQAMALRDARIPFYCEKPIGTIGELPQWGRLNNARSAVGYQYRFHPVYRGAAQMIKRNRHVRFYARDNLLARYGRDCLSAIAAHPIDTALWLLGPARETALETDGVFVRGTIQHKFGISEHDYRIDCGPRVSMVNTLRADGTCYDGWPLAATNDMYLDALAAWLSWVEGGTLDPCTATLADGCAALEVMGEAKYV